MAARLPVYRICKAPKPFGSPCGHRIESPAQTCEAHREADPTRQCAAELPRAGGKVRCAAWPMRGLPYCAPHDPVQVELRREELRSARVRIARVREAVAAAPRLVRDRIFDLLIAEGRVDVAAVEAVAKAYRVLR
jgi:hypothetical protein